MVSDLAHQARGARRKANLIHSGAWTRSLPNQKVISALGFGCSSVWAKPAFDDDLAQRVLNAADEEGITYFDTSPSYGAGVGEGRLGAFLDRRGADGLIISTKVGSNLIADKLMRGFDRDAMRRSFDDSLVRLKRDHVDILYLHGPSVDDLDDDVFRFFDDERVAGRITYSGVNSFDHDVLAKCAASPIDAAMIQYNAGDIRLASAMSALVANGKIVISGTALARAIFDIKTFVPRDFKSLWYLARMARHEPRFLIRGRKMAKGLAEFGNPYHAAIKFVTENESILSNLFGSTNPDHVRANVRAAKAVLDRSASKRLQTSLAAVAALR